MDGDHRGIELLRVVAQLNRWATRHAAFEIPAAQARVLALVDDLAPVRITALAVADNSSQPTMTEQVKRLERAGLVARETAPDDARASLVRLTSRGRRLLEKTRRARAAALAPALAALDPDPDRLAAAVALLEQLLHAARAAGR